MRLKDSSYRKTPSYSAFRNLFIQHNPDDFARVLGEWLRANEGSLPRQLAMDGKFIGTTVGLVSLADATTGESNRKTMDVGTPASSRTRRVAKMHPSLRPSA